MEPRHLHAGLLKARESICEVGRFKFIVRRPTQTEQMLRTSRLKGDALAVAVETVQQNVLGWEGVLESDIKEGEASDEAKFDPVLFRDWIADEPDLTLAIWEHITEAIAGYQTRRETLRGN